MGKRGLRRVGVVSGLAALSLVLVGCGGGSELPPVFTPVPSPTVDATASPSPSVSPAVEPLTTEELLAELPPNAQYPDARGAVAVATYFIGLYPELFRGVDERLWFALVTEDCGWCDQGFSNMQDILDEGYSVQGGELSIQSHTIDAREADPTHWGVRFTVDEADRYATLPGGEPELVAPAGQVEITVALVLVEGVFRVEGVVFDLQDE